MTLNMNHIKLIISIVIILTSCQKENFDIDNLNGNEIGALGHGGMGNKNTSPMDSFESIFKSLSIGADGFEFDIQMTKDSVLVAFHDSKLEESTDGVGLIYQKNWDEISNITYKYPLYADYKLMSLDELFADIANLSNRLDSPDFAISFDCKNFNPDNSDAYVNRFNNALIDIIDKYDLVDNAFIEFRRESLMESLKNKRPDIRILASKKFNSGMQLAEELELFGLVIDTDNITKEQVESAHIKGFVVSVYNIDNKADNIDAINKNVDFIQSDKLKHLIEVLK